MVQGEFSSVQKSRPGGLVTRPSCGSRLWFSATCAALLYSPKRKLMQYMEPYGREVEGSLRDFDQFFKTIVSYGREVDGSWRYFDQFFKAFVCRFRRHGCMKVTA